MDTREFGQVGRYRAIPYDCTCGCKSARNSGADDVRLTRRARLLSRARRLSLRAPWCESSISKFSIRLLGLGERGEMDGPAVGAASNIRLAAALRVVVQQCIQY